MTWTVALPRPRWLLASIALAAATICVAVAPPAVHAAPPANDDFANPHVIDPALPSTTAGNNTDATAETNEPAHGEVQTEGSVWFSWTPAVSGHARISVCGSGLKPFSVYTGNSFETLNRIVRTAAHACIRTFRITAGTTYRIAVDGYFSGSRGPFTVSLSAATPPPNDDFSAAQTIGPNMPITLNSNNFDATAEAGEPGMFGGPAHRSVWYRWTNPSHRVAYPTVDVCQYAYVAVFVGDSLGSLTPVEERYGSSHCKIFFRADPGEEFRIAVDGDRASSSGSDELTFTLTLDGPMAPANDGFAFAQPLGSYLPLSHSASNYLATNEPGEPDHDGVEPEFSVWFVWTSPITGPVTIDTCNTSVDTLLAVYQGSVLGGLTYMASNDDGDACQVDPDYYYTGSAVQLNVTAGAQYRIAVDSYDYGAPFTLNITGTGPQSGPGGAQQSPAKRTTCPKGKKLIKGKCVKKKRKKRKRR